MPTQLLLHVADCSRLRKSRTSILARLWNIVATDSKRAWELFCENDFDMALICHSVPKQHYQWLQQHIQQRSPSTPVLRMMQTDSGILVTEGNLVPDDPQILLDTILRSLHVRNLPQVIKKGA
jgi:hypothetical protein